jgi:DNA-3-methyladenine glycosylase I
MPRRPSSPARTRCDWAGSDPLYITYHDTEWGVPAHDDRHLFEMLVLEGALAWITILRKRQNYRRAFAGFDIAKVARYSPRRIETLLGDPGIVRNRMKVEAAVANARAALAVIAEHGSLDRYLWDFVDGRPIVSHWTSQKELPAETPVSKTMSKALKQRGFKFVGPTICYAFMQAVGMVNDHVTGCFRYREV